MSKFMVFRPADLCHPGYVNLLCTTAVTVLDIMIARRTLYFLELDLVRTGKVFLILLLTLLVLWWVCFLRAQPGR
jgi:hypothetical protein